MGAPAVPLSKEETRRLQHEVKVRSAVEHLVSPANIAACRANGTTVTNCVWVSSPSGDDAVRPSWPASHFCGAPQLRRIFATEADVIKAVTASAVASDSLQAGETGVRIETIVDATGMLLLSPVLPLPD